ncbi:MAG: adenylyltransferase/cytidyltransferase family protein [Bacteroidetes bacterium]|jgi:cytidyltransferase-like protein|nr:adenylyltransferase/cytidyltransferase family protein [Bacteroidota bacterium]MBT4402002.1 adenylyltransferase/cytidyltransferase family protein [Bacteroidota bacterium]MBT4410830.1 adenylyltransferase/cytidyltransferase family protein [Bacteroidota bacterium]MBT5427708.1 adenylyltransferase/cytidyltransferase family protein [Bacteroidota bacterium]MBT7093998.1 adenylyltransferase/cytidyltransferase family protein [Bacteroidota bacterium]
MNKVFVTGCFDMLHSGHVAFLQEASSLGDLYVGIGSDKTVYELKGRYPVVNEDERKYMLEALKSVSEARVNSGTGMMDFIEELNEIKPDLFFVNEDGSTPEKETLCKDLGIEYVIKKRIPHGNLPARSTTALRTICTIPYRIDLAGGWLDQPWVSEHNEGPVLTISIEPTVEFNDRSGMSTSTRKKAIELWQNQIPDGDDQKLAKILFSFENSPGKKEIAGSQDALGIVMPGLNRYDYNGNYWPEKISSNHNAELLDWIEKHVYLITLGPRKGDFDVLDNTSINKTGARALSDAAKLAWSALMKKDLAEFGLAVRQSFEAQISMFPNMVDASILSLIEKYKNVAFGWKLSGAGGGGYLILIADKPIKNAMQIKIRRKD